jgi:hypothetical protein
VAGIKGVAAAAIQSLELEREEEKGVRRLAGLGSDRATWSGSTRWAGPTGGPAADRWARRKFNKEIKQKIQGKTRGFLEKPFWHLIKNKKLLSTLQK